MNIIAHVGGHKNSLVTCNSKLYINSFNKIIAVTGSKRTARLESVLF